VPAADFSFEGLDDVEERVLRRAADIGYITIKDRTDRVTEDPVGRFNFRERDALPYSEPRHEMSQPAVKNPPTDDDDVDDDEDPVDDDGDEFESEEFEDEDESSRDDPGWPPHHNEPPTRRALTQEEIAKAACRWLRDIAARHCVGGEYSRFRVRLYPPKGTKLIDGGHFVCRNLNWTDQIPDRADTMPDLRIPPPNFDQMAKDSTLKGIKALGDYYAQWGQIVLGSVGQLQGVNNSMLARLHSQLQESRGQVDELVASILEFRHNEFESQEQRRVEERAGDTRTELARDALQHLGTAATAFLAGRSVHPDLLETFGAISASPELTEALRDPKVRALMNNSDNLRGLAAMLQAAGDQAETIQRDQAAQQQAHMDQQGADPPTAGPPEPGAPPTPTPEPIPTEPHAAD